MTMKLLNHIGETLLTKLVPGIDAKGDCGRCQPRSWNCPPRCNGQVKMKRTSYYDACGNYCYYTCTPSVDCFPSVSFQ
jgi:hypothetical protein